MTVEPTGDQPIRPVPYTSAYAVAAEGHRIGLITCLRCGCTLTLDPIQDIPALHDAWHREVEGL